MSYKILVLSLALVFISSCKDQTQQTTEIVEVEKIPDANDKGLNGTWELVGFYNYKDNVVVDSFKTNSGARQLKMYTDTKVMWCKHMSADGSEWFGYGTYSYKDNTLTEVLDFGSEVMNEVIAEKKVFKFDLDLQSNRFQQIELDEYGNRIYSENYRRVE